MNDDIRREDEVRAEGGAHRVDDARLGTPDDTAEAATQVRGDNIVLNDAAFADDHTEASYAALLDSIAGEAVGRPEDEVDAIVRQRLGDSGMVLTDVEIRRLVEQIVRGRDVAAVSSDGGEVLAGDADPVALQNPHPAPDADPAHPDRPSYA